MSTQNEHGYGSRRRILDFMLRKFSFNNIKNKLCEANCHYMSVLSYELDVWFWFESLTVATFPALDNGQNNILVNRGQNEEIADLVRLESKIHNWRWLKRKIFKQIGKISIGVLFFLGFFFLGASPEAVKEKVEVHISTSMNYWIWILLWRIDVWLDQEYIQEIGKKKY